MPRFTPNQGWQTPKPGEVLQRQQLQDLAEDMHFTLAGINPGVIAAVQRTRGLIGATGSNIFTTGVSSYMAWNIDHLDNWNNGGRAIASTQGPTLSTGLYMINFSALISTFSAAQNTYNRIEIVIERAGIDTFRRSLVSTQTALRISAPVRIPVGSPQQVKIKILIVSTVGGATIIITRNNLEASPRLSWVQVASG